MADRSKMAADASECVSLSQTAAGVQSNEQRQDSMSDRGRSKYTLTHTQLLNQDIKIQQPKKTAALSRAKWATEWKGNT